MRINEVEALVGITKKNIRFYEAEGLLTPRRNSENGYRDYGDADVAVLRRIKLLRKLGVPLEEIRQMQSGAHTVGDGMRRHLVTLEREQENLAAAARLCAGLTECRDKLENLDAQALLEQMDEMEQRGTTFQNKQRLDIRFRYVAPVVITLLTVALMGSIGALMPGATCRMRKTRRPWPLWWLWPPFRQRWPAACCWHWCSGSGKSEGGSWMKRGNSDKRWNSGPLPLRRPHCCQALFCLPSLWRCCRRGCNVF